MEQVSEIMKKELEDGQRAFDELRFAVPVLKRVLARLDEFIKEEKEDGNNYTCFGLFLATQTIKSEIKKLEGK